MVDKGKFHMKTIYLMLLVHEQKVSWRKLLYHIVARPRALITLWLVCHERLATRGRLHHLGMVDKKECNFCAKEETVQHLFFECDKLKTIWRNILKWIQVVHEPGGWESEIKWLIPYCKGKGKKSDIMKLAIAETVYKIWHYRNEVSFGQSVNNTNIEDRIINTIIYRA
ncbi:uncharacterized protein LOC131649554 [Vicia villosa]|uniref:uncharacterized protein LOC131649554 n=1 Tax=Vicia villosa TaxID=3911 RepID=UPI00273BFFF6|nr:uncharacterized protein LOC131649554 [Vicia villosa]